MNTRLINLNKKNLEKLQSYYFALIKCCIIDILKADITDIR